MKFLLHCHISSSTGIRRYCALALLCVPSICWAVTASGPSGAPRSYAHAQSAHAKTDGGKTAQAKAHSAEASPAPAVESTAAGETAKAEKAPEPADAPAKPATVSLESGRLTVTANNSDLGEILRKVASISGMKIDGLEKSARVFGAYGPGTPRDILADLLAGSDYNFMMVGNTVDGAPRHLLLTAKNDSAPSLNPAGPGPAEPRDDPAEPSDNDDGDPAQPLPTKSVEPSRPAEPVQPVQATQSSEPDADTSDAEPLGPGAVLHPPPPPPEDPQQRMQQKLQQLQKMHPQSQQDAPQ